MAASTALSFVAFSTSLSIFVQSLKVQKNFTAEPGQTVTLTCRVPNNVTVKVVEWIRPDLDPNNVFLYRNRQADRHNQHPSFKNRVELKDKDMKDGDVSVIVKNVTINDTGTYKCYVRNSNIPPPPQFITNITLTVTGGAAGYLQVGGVKDECLGLLVSLSVVTVLLVVGGGGGFMFYRKYKRLKKQIYQPPVDEATGHELPVLIPKPE